jgi:hypothetical protein
MHSRFAKVDMGDHRESPLHAFVGAGLRACPKIFHLDDFDTSLLAVLAGKGASFFF